MDKTEELEIVHSDTELQVMVHLVEAWDTFISMYGEYAVEIDLAVYHDDDVSEFRHCLHRLQHILATRAMRRLHPEIWMSYPPYTKPKKDQV